MYHAYFETELKLKAGINAQYIVIVITTLKMCNAKVFNVIREQKLPCNGV